jgi:hypothetical protein
MDVEKEKVLGLLEDARVARALCCHERNERMRNTCGGYYWLDERGQYRCLSGLLPRLRAVFWPQSASHPRAKRATTTTPTDCGIKKARKAGRGAAGGGGGGGRFAGVIKGSQVHRQLHDFVTLDERQFKKRHGALHPYCARLLRCIVEQKRWHPLLPEHDIYDEQLGIGTSVDMICVDARGGLKLLEFKTGYRDYFEAEDGKMARSLSALANSVQNQATLQLGTAALILERRYGVPRDAMELLVMRVDDERVELVRVPDGPAGFLAKMGDAVYGDLFNFQQAKSAH